MDTFVIGFTSLFLPNMSLVFPSVTSGNVRVASYLSTAVAPIGLKPMFSTLFFTLDSCFSKLFSSMLKNEWHKKISQLKAS